jgi:hypothetical protein
MDLNESNFAPVYSRTERRRKRRYPLALHVRWKLIPVRSVPETGTGTTKDVSSGGILFCPNKELPEGHQLEMSISWPVLLENFPALQLAVSGLVIRTTENGSAVRILNHEFRTMAREGGESPQERRRLALVPVQLHSRWK